MITIPTTELIGCLADVLPQISDPKGALAGVAIRWDGDTLHFTTYDVYSGATVSWTPGEGAEGSLDDDEKEEGPGWDDDIAWGGDDDPWETWIRLDQAKDILKLFKLPAKLWRFPVTMKCSLSGDRLTIERTDSPKGQRLLVIPGDRDMLKKIPDVRAVAYAENRDYKFPRNGRISFANTRLGAFGAVRYHGVMTLDFGSDDEPAGVRMGTRFAGFLYPAGAKNVRPYNFLRDASGVRTTTRQPGDFDPQTGVVDG